MKHPLLTAAALAAKDIIVANLCCRPMRSQFLVKGAGVLMVALGSITTAYAVIVPQVPFQTTPQGFIDYANATGMNEGENKYTFYNPSRCDYYTGSITPFMNCYVDYTETTSLGTRTCIGGRINWYDWNGLNWANSRAPYVGKSNQCGEWNKDPLGSTGAVSNSLILLLAAGLGGAFFLIAKKRSN